MGMQIMGLDELDDFLRTSPAEIADGPIRKALKAGGTVLKEAIEERVPELDGPEGPTSDALPPGALKGDITLKITVAQGGGTAIVEPGKYTLHVARWVEYGHAQIRGGYSRLVAAGKRRGPGKEIGHVPAHPFIRPAVEATIEQAKKVMYETFGVEMTKIARRKLRSGGSGSGRAA